MEEKTHSKILFVVNFIAINSQGSTRYQPEADRERNRKNCDVESVSNNRSSKFVLIFKTGWNFVFPANRYHFSLAVCAQRAQSKKPSPRFAVAVQFFFSTVLLLFFYFVYLNNKNNVTITIFLWLQERTQPDTHSGQPCLSQMHGMTNVYIHNFHSNTHTPTHVNSLSNIESIYSVGSSVSSQRFVALFSLKNKLESFVVWHWVRRKPCLCAWVSVTLSTVRAYILFEIKFSVRISTRWRKQQQKPNRCAFHAPAFIKHLYTEYFKYAIESVLVCVYFHSVVCFSFCKSLT